MINFILLSIDANASGALGHRRDFIHVSATQPHLHLKGTPSYPSANLPEPRVTNQESGAA